MHLLSSSNNSIMHQIGPAVSYILRKNLVWTYSSYDRVLQVFPDNTCYKDTAFEMLDAFTNSKYNTTGLILPGPRLLTWIKYNPSTDK